MESSSLPTEFAPAERAHAQEVERQARMFKEEALLPFLLDAVPNVFLVLNRERQIVFANEALLTLLCLENSVSLLGQRPGEALSCVHAHETAGGCGTTEFCRTCGAVRAVLASQRGKKDTQECRVIRASQGDALDLRVTATPLAMSGERFTCFALEDISHEKRRRALERIFFHDVLNTAGVISGFAELLSRSGPDVFDRYKDRVYSATKRLIDEIGAQRELAAAESGELPFRPMTIESLRFLNEIAESYERHEAARDRAVVVAPDAENVVFKSDDRILRRVIGNMTKNAVEASEPGETVTLGCARRGESVAFTVHNVAVMSRNVQNQVFQRSFSTKGADRGLGTYSMRLLSERYLQGEVSFTTAPDQGTTFTGRYPLEPKTDEE